MLTKKQNKSPKKSNRQNKCQKSQKLEKKTRDFISYLGITFFGGILLNPYDQF